MAEDAARQREEGLVGVLAPLVAGRQAAVAGEPGEGALDDPAVAAEAVGPLDAAAGDAGLDAPLPARQAAPRVVVPLVGVELGRPLPTPSGRGADRRHRVEHGLERRRVVAVGGADPGGQRDARRVAQDVELDPGLAPVGRVAAGAGAPLFAGTEALSRQARSQAILSALPSRSSRARCAASQTPASCQSRSRRQQVAGLAVPGPRGTADHGAPVQRTKRMPHSAARSSAKGRPPLGCGRRRGSSGATTSQRASAKRGMSIGG